MKTKKITTIAMFCAVAFLVSLVQIPFNGFLDLEVKSAVITICAFLLGPLAGLIISIIVPVIELLTVSHTGPIGLLMNVIATCAFVCPAALIYKRNHSMKGAVIGLIVGSVTLTVSMLLWNYIITPIYLNVPRQVVEGMLVPVLLPFNLIKAASNMAVTLLLYKPVVHALRKAKLVSHNHDEGKKEKTNTGVMIVALILLLTCVLLVMAFRGLI
jgi:riboflavin transporter FmnP